MATEEGDDHVVFDAVEALGECQDGEELVEKAIRVESLLRHLPAQGGQLLTDGVVQAL